MEGPGPGPGRGRGQGLETVEAAQRFLKTLSAHGPQHPSLPLAGICPKDNTSPGPGQGVAQMVAASLFGETRLHLQRAVRKKTQKPAGRGSPWPNPGPCQHPSHFDSDTSEPHWGLWAHIISIYQVCVGINYAHID